MNKSCSYFKPKRGRIYKQEIITEEKVNDNIEDKDLKDKDKSIKISLELNTENNNNKIINSDNNVFEIKESELNSINSEKEEEKENNNNNSVITTTNNSNVFETEIKFRNSSDFKKILANFETELKKSRSEFCSKINEEIKEIKNR